MGCRKLNVVEHFDDMSGTVYFEEELEEMAFVFDGAALVLDLDEENAAAFRAAMAPFVRKARRTTKSKILATLPRRARHLRSVSPSSDPVPEPDGSDQNAPISPKGESTEARTEPEGTPVPEAAPRPSDSGPGSPIQNGNLVLRSKSQDVDSRVEEEPAKPALTIVPPPGSPPLPEAWAPYAPELRDDKADRMLKARQWAGQLGMDLPDNKVTPEVLERWKGFYRERRWTHLS